MKKSKKEIKPAEQPLTEETVQTLAEIGQILRRIHDRLFGEGKIRVVDGKIMPVEQDE